MAAGSGSKSRRLGHISREASMRPLAPGFALDETGIALAITAAGIVVIWAINDLHSDSVGTIATWVASLVMVVSALFALAHKGRHAGWFHPLSLPLATITVMSLGTILWVYFTHQAVGLSTVRNLSHHQHLR
jgi:hypothetical protein